MEFMNRNGAQPLPPLPGMHSCVGWFLSHRYSAGRHQNQSNHGVGDSRHMRIIFMFCINHKEDLGAKGTNIQPIFKPERSPTNSQFLVETMPESFLSFQHRFPSVRATLNSVILHKLPMLDVPCMNKLHPQLI